MSKDNKMSPPPPSRITFTDELVDGIVDEFDELDLHYPPTATSKVKHTAPSSQIISKLSSSSSSSSSIFNSSSSSSISMSTSTFSDDFTLGLRVSGSTGQAHQSNSNLNKNHHHHQQQAQEHQSPSFHSHKHGHSQRRSSQPLNSYRQTNSKERYVFSNFRFLVKEESVIPKSADEAFDWHSIEMVLVPEIENVLCPICLDIPCVPRFTRCGHIYCLPCLLQFFQTSEASPDGLGNNWRTCPVCAEPLHLKQLRPIKFCPATEPKEGEIFHSILIEKPVGSLRPNRPIFPNDSLTSLSPFQRCIPISRTFVLNQIMTPDLLFLRNELKKRKSFGEDSLELSFYEAAIKFIDDQRKQITTTSDDTTIKTINPKQSGEFYYYHQSRDGLNVFLHPLCMKILKHHFHTYDSIPSELSLPIIQLERVIVNSSNRKRFKYLDHLSLGTQIILVEVDLRSIVSISTLQFHQKELSNRKDARDQKLAVDSQKYPGDRSILEEWKRMEDDYYLTAQAASAMDIRVPESVKLDNLDDEASFPLPSSYNNNNNNPSLAIPVKKKVSPALSAGSPSFSALAHSLNSPFTFNPNFNSSSNSDNSTKNPWSSSVNSPSPSINNSWISSTNSSTSSAKKKIVLFSNGLNLNNTKKNNNNNNNNSNNNNNNNNNSSNNNNNNN